MRLFGLFAKTKLQRHTTPSGKVTRIYVYRRGMTAKLWFEKAALRFNVGHKGNEDDFTVMSSPGEPIHLIEARAALNDIGLDLNTCTWDELLAKAR